MQTQSEDSMVTKFLSLLFISLSLLTSVQTASAQSSDEAAVTQALESLRKAMIAKDRGQFETLLSENVSYGHSAGRIETKAEFIKVALASKSVLKSLTFTEQATKVTGNNAIVRFMYNGESELDGKVSTTKIGVLTVWQKEQGAWKLYARQAYRL
jgi:ketosteroid isomerase-like protein